MLGWLALAMALGIGAAERWELPPQAAAGPAGLGLGLGLSRRTRRVAALGLAAACGLHAQAARLSEARLAAGSDARAVLVEGQVLRRAAAVDPRWIELVEVRGAGASRLRVFAPEPADLDPWLPGDRLRAWIDVRPLRPARNPGREDAGRRDARAGIGARGVVRHPGLVVARAGAGWPRAVHRLRRRIGRDFDAAGPGGGLLRGLALGDRAALASRDREAFARLGLAHALAVSGLHLAVVAAAVHALTRLALGRSATLAARWDTRALALGPALGAAIGYAALAGAGIPVQRALLLLVVASGSLWRGRPQRRGQALGAAALWILWREPQALFSLGAQLSFAAVAALSWAAASPDPPAPTAPDTDRRGAARGRGLGGTALRRSATAILATGPILAWHGGGVSSVALAANWIALPWLAGVLLPAALLAAAALALGLPGADAIASGAAALATLSLDALGQAGQALPAAERAPLSPLAGVGCCAVALAGLCTRGTAGRAALAGLLGVGLGLAPGAAWEPAPPRLVVLDVGQGDATLVQGRRAAVLVDAGPARAGWDAGRRRVVPALRALGVSELALVVVTHADLDHRGGVPAVLESFSVGEVWVPFGAATEPAFATLREAARAAGTPLYEAGRGAARRRWGDLRVEPLWPPRLGSGSRNARSLVLRVEVEGGARVLLPGDLDREAEAAWLARELDPRADVLIVPHHGSRSSSSPDFLDAVAPRLAIVSAPCFGRFGMPHAEVRERLARRSLPWGWTGRDGALRVSLRGDLVLRGTGRPARCP